MDDTMDKSEAAQEWLVYAEDDFGSAEYLLGRRPLPLEVICFLCQQSAEKVLKGLLVLQGIRPPRIHDLVEIYDLCEPFTLDINTILTPCKDLNDYSVRPRYPDEIVINEDRMKKALADAKAIMEFTRPLYSQK
jgi:HEPN domain-containing protein